MYQTTLLKEQEQWSWPASIVNTTCNDCEQYVPSTNSWQLWQRDNGCTRFTMPSRI